MGIRGAALWSPSSTYSYRLSVTRFLVDENDCRVENEVAKGGIKARFGGSRCDASATNGPTVVRGAVAVDREAAQDLLEARENLVTH